VAITPPRLRAHVTTDDKRSPRGDEFLPDADATADQLPPPRSTSDPGPVATDPQWWWSQTREEPDMSRPKQLTNNMAKASSPLHVIGAGFLATTAGGTRVSVACADRSVIAQGNAPADSLASRGSLVHDDR
jgi:hypothetical protein